MSFTINIERELTTAEKESLILSAEKENVPLKLSEQVEIETNGKSESDLIYGTDQ